MARKFFSNLLVFHLLSDIYGHQRAAHRTYFSFSFLNILLSAFLRFLNFCTEVETAEWVILNKKSANVLKILYHLNDILKNIFFDKSVYREKRISLSLKLILTLFWFKIVHCSKAKAGLIFKVFVTDTSLFVTKWHFDKKRTRSITSVYKVVLQFLFQIFITITTDCFLSWSNKQVN